MRTHPHAAGGLDHIRIDVVDRDVRVGEHQRERQHDEREDDVRRPDPEDAESDRDHGQARQGAADVREVDRDERASMDVAEGDAQRDREQKRDSHRLSADLKMLRGLLPHQPRVVGHEPERVDERVRLEGVER